MRTEMLFRVIEIAAVVVSAVSGVLEARKKKMDFVGVYAVALITAFGGGTVRDVLLDRRPLYWVENDQFVIWIFALCIGLLYGTRGRILSQKLIDVPDALGLGLFSVTGAYYALEHQTGLFIASLFGVITGVFGGVLRDVVCNEVPAVFSPSTSLYATCSFVGAWTYLLLLRTPAAAWAAIAGIVVTFLLRMAAIRYNIGLPKPLDERG